MLTRYQTTKLDELSNLSEGIRKKIRRLWHLDGDIIPTLRRRFRQAQANFLFTRQKLSGIPDEAAHLSKMKRGLDELEGDLQAAEEELAGINEQLTAEAIKRGLLAV